MNESEMAANCLEHIQRMLDVLEGRPVVVADVRSLWHLGPETIAEISIPGEAGFAARYGDYSGKGAYRVAKKDGNVIFEAAPGVVRRVANLLKSRKIHFTGDTDGSMELIIIPRKPHRGKLRLVK